MRVDRITQLQPGDYYVVAWERSESFGSEPDADLGFLKTAYPANADIAGARRVPIRDGQNAIRIDITMLPARAADISGRVITANGLAAANVMLVLQSVDSGPGSGLGSDARSGADRKLSVAARHHYPAVQAARAAEPEAERGAPYLRSSTPEKTCQA